MIERNYITIQGWMLEELHLKNAALIAYALIYGFTQDGSPKQLSLTYVAKWCGATKKTAIEALKSLEKAGLIQVTKKGKNGLAKNFYYPARRETSHEEKGADVTQREADQCKNNTGNETTTTGEEITPPSVKTTPVTSVETKRATNTYRDNTGNKDVINLVLGVKEIWERAIREKDALNEKAGQK